MGATQAIPIVGEVVTLAVGGGKVVMAGACAALGRTKAAEQLIQGASQTFRHYYEVNVIAANIHMAIAVTSGDRKKVRLLKKLQCTAWLDVASNTPVVGHWIGVVRYAHGDVEGGDRCILGASRSAVVLTAMLATGSAGAMVCGATAACLGLVYDGIATGCNSAAKEQFMPVGIVAAINHAAETLNANDMFDAAAILVADGAAGALHGHFKGRAKRVHSEGLTKAKQAAPAAWCSPLPVRYRACNSSLRQASLTELRANQHTAAYVKEFQSHTEAISQLESGQKYYFAWMQDGKMITIKQSDAAYAGQMLGANDTSIDHTSLVEPGTRVDAAGEIHIGPTGAIENINCQSGRFAAPLSSMRGQMGRVFPRSALTIKSDALEPLLSSLAPTHIAIYTPTLIAALAGYNPTPTPLSSSSFILAFWENDMVKMVALPGIDKTCAEDAFNKIPAAFPKVLMRRPGNRVIDKRGGSQAVSMCREEVRFINGVFPQGCWRRRSQNVEAWFDASAGTFQMRCACRTWDCRSWQQNHVEFKPEDCMEINRQGKLLKLN